MCSSLLSFETYFSLTYESFVRKFVWKFYFSSCCLDLLFRYLFFFANMSLEMLFTRPMTMVSDVLTPLSDYKQEFVEKIDRRIRGFRICVGWISTTGFCVVGFYVPE